MWCPVGHPDSAPESDPHPLATTVRQRSHPGSGSRATRGSDRSTGTTSSRGLRNQGRRQERLRVRSTRRRRINGQRNRNLSPATQQIQLSHPEIQPDKLPKIRVDWLSQQSSSFMAVCHRVSADKPGLFGADTEQDVLGDQLADDGARSLLGEKLERAEFADHRRRLAYYPEHLRYGVAAQLCMNIILVIGAAACRSLVVGVDVPSDTASLHPCPIRPPRRDPARSPTPVPRPRCWT